MNKYIAKNIISVNDVRIHKDGVDESLEFLVQIRCDNISDDTVEPMWLLETCFAGTTLRTSKVFKTFFKSKNDDISNIRQLKGFLRQEEKRLNVSDPDRQVRIEMNDEILNKIQSITNRLPSMSSKKFKEDFFTVECLSKRYMAYHMLIEMYE